MTHGFRIPYARPLDLSRHLGGDGDLTSVFRRLNRLPHCAWLDSVSDRQYDRGRYSFLSADPVAWCCADTSSPDPWPVLQEWCRKLNQVVLSDRSERGDGSEQVAGSVSDTLAGGPTDTVELPPFCGGIVALLAYESSWWLEPSLRQLGNEMLWDANLPGMALGLYDWTIAVDHHQNRAWLLSTGIDETFRIDSRRATARAAQVLAWIGRSDAECHEEGSFQEAPQKRSQQANAVADDLEASGCGARGFGSRGFGSRGQAALTSNFTDESYARGVGEIVSRIRRGDSFQVNLAQTLSQQATCGPAELYERLRRINPAPYACYFDAGEYCVISSSPEGFLQVRTDADGHRHVVTRPIKGTVARTGDAETDVRLGDELLASQKDRSENIMIVDLMRNDLSRVCTDESVEVTGLCELERYQRVQHLVSTVRGVLTPDASVCDLLAACFPGGSITGAPKVEAMRTIAELERRPRGPYCGSLGYISLSGAADFNILIRTITHRDAGPSETVSNETKPGETKPGETKPGETKPGGYVWEFPVGGGITARSNPERETQETWVKAASLLEAIASPR